MLEDLDKVASATGRTRSEILMLATKYLKRIYSTYRCKEQLANEEKIL